MPDPADLPALFALLNDLGRGLAALVIFLAGVAALEWIRHRHVMNVLAEDKQRLANDGERWKLRKAQEKPPKGGRPAGVC